MQALEVALRVLETVTEGPLGVTEIARRVGTTKMRAFRHLRTLMNAGYVTQDRETEKYAAGVKIWLMGQAMAEQFGFISVVRKVMKPLRDRVGHTVTAAKFESDGLRVVEMVRGKSNIEIGTRPGSSLGFHSSAQGKLALAFGPPSLAEAILKSTLIPETSKTVTDPRRLKKQIAAISSQGWAVAPEEAVLGINALAAPILDAAGALVGTIALVDLVQFLPADPRPECIAAIQRAAMTASRDLGYSEARFNQKSGHSASDRAHA